MHYPPNPHYGNGRYRRAIHLDQSMPGLVVALMEDTNHGFSLHLSHDGHCITDLSAKALRIPLNTCVDAPGQLAQLVGFPLSGALADWFRKGNPSAQCTHLFDLATLAFRHAGRAAKERRYDIIVEDADRDGILDMRALRDGEQVFHWRMNSELTATYPECIAGKPMMRGFHQWASELFTGDDLELAAQLQRGGFVSFARRFDHNAVSGKIAAEDGVRLGTCYSYSESRIHQSVRLTDSVRDFSDCPEQLLTFQ